MCAPGVYEGTGKAAMYCQHKPGSSQHVLFCHLPFSLLRLQCLACSDLTSPLLALCPHRPEPSTWYVAQGEVLADGSDAKEVAQWEARRAAELELKEAEEAVRQGEEVRPAASVLLSYADCAALCIPRGVHACSCPAPGGATGSGGA